MTLPSVRAVAIAFAFVAAIAGAQTPADSAFEARLKHLESELRCLVCQNQTLADSNAPLAEDLRREVRGLASSAKSDDEIKQYLVARYGDFVLYKPPLQSNTWLLWLGPFALLFSGGAIWYAVVRRRDKRDDDDDDPPPPAIGPSNDAIAKARLMLYEEP